MRRNYESAPELAALQHRADLPSWRGREGKQPASSTARPGEPATSSTAGPMRTTSWSWVDGWRDQFARSYYDWLRPSAETVLCVWLVITAAAWLGSQDVFEHISTQSNGRSDTPASLAQAALGASFPRLVWDHAVVSVRCRSGCDVFNPDVQAFTEDLSARLESYYPEGIFDPPVSLFGVLPTGGLVSAGSADVQLQQSVERFRLSALEVERDKLSQSGDGRSPGNALPVNTSHAAAAIARANLLLRNASRSDAARLELIDRMRRAGGAFYFGLASGTSSARPPTGQPIGNRSAPPPPSALLPPALLPASLLGGNVSTNAALLQAATAFTSGLRQSVDVPEEPGAYTYDGYADAAPFHPSEVGGGGGGGEGGIGDGEGGGGRGGGGESGSGEGGGGGDGLRLAGGGGLGPGLHPNAAGGFDSPEPLTEASILEEALTAFLTAAFGGPAAAAPDRTSSAGATASSTEAVAGADAKSGATIAQADAVADAGVEADASENFSYGESSYSGYDDTSADTAGGAPPVARPPAPPGSHPPDWPAVPPPLPASAPAAAATAASATALGLVSATQLLSDVAWEYRNSTAALAPVGVAAGRVAAAAMGSSLGALQAGSTADAGAVGVGAAGEGSAAAWGGTRGEPSGPEVEAALRELSSALTDVFTATLHGQAAEQV